MSIGKRSYGELLIINELAIKELYETFADVFPEQQQLWRRLALEEKKHADWLEILRFEPILYEALLRDCRVKAHVIESAISYIEQQTERARGGQFSLREALCLARDIEKSLLENQFSNISDSVPAEIRSMLLRLAADTQRHHTEIARSLEALAEKK